MIAKKYRASGFPSNYGLTWNFVLIRKNTPELADLMERWYQETLVTYRDQLSLMYVLWKGGLELNTLQINPTRSIPRCDYDRDYGLLPGINQFFCRPQGGVHRNKN